jgi:DNA-binding response OmpR family regulator
MTQKILAVDDDESILEVIQLVLEGEGYLVQASLNGECFQNIAGDLPNLILLDVLLSGEDGREICKRLKSDATTARVPIIMLSAHSDTSKIADTSGADDYLEKPFDVDVLIEIVEKHLASAQSSNSSSTG